MNEILDMDDLMSNLGAEDLRPIDAKLHDLISDPQGVVEVHPTADIFPKIKDYSADSFAQLTADIKANNVNESIKITKDGAIIDGRNRIDCIRELMANGSKPTFNVEVMNRPDAELRSWIISTNLHRRHLNESQRAVIAETLATATKSSGGKMSGTNPEHVPPVSIPEAAKQMNVSKTLVERSRQVKKLAKEAGDGEIVEQVKLGKKTVTGAVIELKERLGKPVGALATRKKKPASKEAPAGAGQPTTPAPSGVVPNSGLSEAQVTECKALLAAASASQLVGLSGYLRTQQKFAK
jgi:hypothetical protein